MIRITIFLIITFIGVTTTQAKVCELKNIKSISSLKEKIKNMRSRRQTLY